ncbi:hypothetical protein [Nonomuraea rhizosphaerae]|uniref:hypothetical protein n=1 Tax=Nonomuraea rhizosphaerae TaxID=2665663 RepID=UPI001C5F76EA|nr:hypothetical protein [Nonomuraea rhizosphaerae]
MADEVGKLLEEADRLPYGEARTVLVERALRVAETLPEPEPAIAVRLALTQSYQFGGEPGKSFTTFSRTLAAYDAEPGRFTEAQARRVLWQYKWIMTDMLRFPEIPLARALAALDDMERRFRQAGKPHAVNGSRARFAWHLGDERALEEWLHRWEITPRDDLSDCRACDISARAHLLSQLGRDTEAVAMAGPVLDGRFTCRVQPQSILCTLLPPYVRTGLLDAAAEGHRRAYRIVQGQVAYLDDIGDHLRFCALTGNRTRGLEILERELPLLDRAPSPAQARAFMTGGALVLLRLLETGHDALTVRRHGADVPVPELHATLAAGAREIAARFDARNGSDVHTRRVEAALSAARLVDHLPLLPHARLSLSRAAATGTGQRWDDPALRELAEQVARLTADGDTARMAPARVELCRAYLRAERPLDAAETAEETLPLLDPADRVNGRKVRRVLAEALLALGEHDAALAALEPLKDPGAFMDAGDTLAGRDEDEAAARAYERAAEVYRRADDVLSAGWALRLRARSVYYASDDATEIRRAYDLARTALRAADPGRAAPELAKLAYEEAVALQWSGDREEAAERGREALDACTALDDQEGAQRARDLLDELREQDD